MPRDIKRKLHKVVLYVESPEHLSEPSEWDWNSIVNTEKDTRNHAPVILHHSEPWKMGTA